MSILFNAINFMSFLSGIVFGLLISFAAIVHYLSDHSNKPNTSDQLHEPHATLSKQAKESEEIPTSPLPADVHGSYVSQKLSKGELSRLNELIEFLDDFNSPFKNIKPILERIHLNKEQELENLETKMKTIIEYSAINKCEKDFQDAVGQLKDHSKQIKLISNFLYDLAKVFSNFSRDVSKLSNTARSNMHKSSQSLDRKEDMIANNWWQTLQIALDSIANDQEDLSTIISEELINYSNQIQEEIAIIEKRLAVEGSKHFSNLREQLNIFEQRLKERDKTKEKLKNTPIQASPMSSATGPSESYQRRAQRLKAAEDLLVTQTKKLYEVQREFYQLLPRIHSDVQLTIIKSIVETQSQLLKLSETIERNQTSHKSICHRMKTQLTNAASSLVQMIREESSLLPDSSLSLAASNSASNLDSSIALQIMKQRMREAGIKGFELTLKQVLEGLMLQSQLKDMTSSGGSSPYPSSQQRVNVPIGAYAASSNSSASSGALRGEDLSSLNLMEDQGKLDMFKEATAYLAASNPFILPELPKSFRSAIATETCVWFNAFSGRVYRDVANSPYFHRWFCLKVAQMLNKKRPDYIDKFEVIEVTFGELPPLLLNMKWSPLLKKRGSSRTKPRADESMATEEKERSRSRSMDDGRKRSEKKSDEVKEGSSAKEGEEMNESDSDSSAGEDEELEEEEEGLDGVASKKSAARPTPGPEQHIPLSSNVPEDNQFYAACTADLAFRSGLKFTVSTKLWINWPRDRYASVPVMFYVDLAELVGSIRFGVERTHSFVTFLGDPTTRISVRSEVGGDKYKLKDIPQISDYIVKKMKKIIHRRLVYPHAHKFRLIWPRNWWPEGTENLFLAADQPLDSNGRPLSRPHSPVPATRPAESRTPSTNSTAAVTETSPLPNETSNTTKQLFDVTSKLMNKARAFNFGAAISSPATAATAPVTQTPPQSSKSPAAPSKVSPSSAVKEEKVAGLSVELKWWQHVKTISERRTSPLFFSSSYQSLSELDKRRIRQQFSLKQKERAISRVSLLASPQRSHSVKAESSAEKSESETQFKRSFSISEFRTAATEAILEEVFDRMRVQAMDAVDESADPALTTIQANREGSLPNVLRTNRANSSHGVGEATRRLSSEGGGLSGPVNNLAGGSNAATSSGGSGWFSTKGREAKAKLLEFKNKHFGQGKGGASHSSHGAKTGGAVDGTGSTAEMDLDKAYKSAAKFGGKIKDLFNKMQDEFSSESNERSAGVAAKRGSASRTRSSDEMDHHDYSRHSETAGRDRKHTMEDGAPRSADLGIDESHSNRSQLKETTKKFMSSMFGGGGGGGHDFGGFTRSSRVMSDTGMNQESRANSILTKALAVAKEREEEEEESPMKMSDDRDSL